MKYLDQGFKAEKPAATVSVPPRQPDAVSTFIQDLETNIRSRVKTSLHDDLFLDINSTMLDYKKKQSAYIDVSTIPNYDPLLPVRSFQVGKRSAASVDTFESIPSSTQPQGSRQRRQLETITVLQDVSEGEEDMKEEEDDCYE